MQTFTSAKQVYSECEKVLKQEIYEGESERIWTFRELLSWKMPESLISPSCGGGRDFNRLNSRVMAGAGVEQSGLLRQVLLYKLDTLTNRVKEQKVSFVGVVSHVK